MRVKTFYINVDTMAFKAYNLRSGHIRYNQKRHSNTWKQKMTDFFLCIFASPTQTYIFKTGPNSTSFLIYPTVFGIYTIYSGTYIQV